MGRRGGRRRSWQWWLLTGVGLVSACDSVTIGSAVEHDAAPDVAVDAPSADGAPAADAAPLLLDDGSGSDRRSHRDARLARDAPPPDSSATFHRDAPDGQQPMDAADASAGPGPFPPGGLVLHLDAGALSLSDGAAVATWPDRSGRSYDATAISEPTFVRMGINGRPAVSFDGVNDGFALPPGFQDFTQGVTVFIVAELGSSGYGAKFLSLGNGPDTDTVVLGRAGSTEGLQYFTGNGATAGFIESQTGFEAGAVAVFGAYQPAGVPDSSVTGVATTNGVPLASGFVSVPPRVERQVNYVAKSHYSDDAYFAGLIAEIVLYARLLSSTERAAVQNYFSDKYGL